MLSISPVSPIARTMNVHLHQPRLCIAILVLSSPLPSVAQAVWTSSKIPGTNNWSALASSADGMKLVAASYDDPAFNPGRIYTSTNGGVDWVVTSAPSNFWYGVASSTNGVNLAAAVFGGGIYTSADSGVSWTPAASAPYGVWYAIASSWDGARLVAVSGGAERFIYTSPDTGQTWVSNNVPDSEYWYAVASSADGRVLAAVSNSNTNGGAGAVYTSTNSGNTWTAGALTGIRWTGIGASGDGKKLVACGFSSALYTSVDAGLNWKPVTGVFGFFTGAASSADGSRLVVISNGGQIYSSIDSAANWTSNNVASLAWQDVALSRDGNVIAAAVPSDQIYVGRSTPALTLISSGAQGLLSWPWPSPGFVLQHNVDLSTTNWQTTVKAPALTNWRYELGVLRSNPQNFFRLTGP